MAARTIHIAVLDTDIPCYPVYAKRGLYSSQFNFLLTAAANRINASEYHQHKRHLSVHTTAYDVVGGSFPHLKSLRVSPWSPSEIETPGFPGPIDAILVTGAAAAVYDKLHWIAGLQSFIEKVYADHPMVKIFGSCFGHQLIGQALLASDKSYMSQGSSFKISVEPSSDGHEIGMHPITLNPAFVSNFPPLARFTPEKPFHIQIIHGDAVISSAEDTLVPGKKGTMLPEPWLTIGSSLKCPIQGLYKPGHVLTLQGHFEFDAFATAELCHQFANQFHWPAELLASHLENIRRSVVLGNEDDDSKIAAEAVLLFFAGEDQSFDVNLLFPIMAGSNPRSTNACETCRRRKVKCSGDKPCRACVKHNWECTFGHSGRRRFSEAQVKHLLEKIRTYEGQLSSQSVGGPVSSLSSPVPAIETPGRQSVQRRSSTPGNREPPNQRQEELLYPDNDPAISPATDLTSGPAFESQVRSLLDRSHSNDHNFHGSTSNFQYQADRLPQWSSVKEIVDNVAGVSFPSLEESHHLLDQFLFYLGVSQHFFDPRSFSDELMLLFQSPETREQHINSPWFTEYLLVMAMAKLMDVKHPTSQIPGADLFAEALNRLPPLHHMGGEGVLAVEILTLIATYLQWCDRKHDAYLYIGLALRLAIALGCNLRETDQRCLPSQSAHRLRLWWTVYMLDRRLSSGLGLAAGADERQLRTELPRNAMGFQSPIALAINVRIARVTDDIMSSLYGNKSITQLELVQKIQQILQELHDTGRSFPKSLMLDFSRPLQLVSRTGASLYLMLFQAIILCTRPILLQRARFEAQNQQQSQSPDPGPSILLRLCDTCDEAATRSLAILESLRRQQTIPRYGFFDLDATFSAAFVLVMVGFLDKSQIQPPPALDKASKVLQFLSQSGNLAAERRLQDIAQSCSHVWPDHVFNANASHGDAASRKTRAFAASPGSRQDTLLTSSDSPPYTAMASSSRGIHQDEIRLLEPWSDMDVPDAMFDMQGDWNLDLSGEAEGIYSSFHNPTLPLTGVDYTDWLEIEKVFNG
ncbi:unnamed protein product [Penicillium glandicola]